MPFELPLFPLNVVLFPGMPLPLHIFEPRYRLMIGRCLEKDRTFGVAMLSEGQEGHSGTLPATVGCTAEITEVSPLADGRMNLHTIGMRRFQVLTVREEDEYLVGTCEWLDDDAETAQTPVLARRALERLRAFLQALGDNVSLPAELTQLDVPEEAEILSLFIAAMLTLPNAQKQQLLEMTSTDMRLEIEEYLLERATIVQRAYARRSAEGGGSTVEDTSLGQLSGFVSLN